MWVNLSRNGTRVDTIVLPGNMTGRQHDRYFRCVLLGSAPSAEEKETWEDYLHDTVDHVDFVEIDRGSFGKDNFREN
jgi:hypothetical protein